jgi:hypothetical protein
VLRVRPNLFAASDNGLACDPGFGLAWRPKSARRGNNDEPTCVPFPCQAFQTVILMKTFLLWFFTSEASIQLPSVPLKGPPAFLLVCVILAVASAVWVARDAARRGKSGLAAAAFILLAWWPVSILFWRWLRPPVSVPPPLPKSVSLDA